MTFLDDGLNRRLVRYEKKISALEDGCEEITLNVLHRVKR